MCDLSIFDGGIVEGIAGGDDWGGQESVECRSNDSNVGHHRAERILENIDIDETALVALVDNNAIGRYR